MSIVSEIHEFVDHHLHVMKNYEKSRKIMHKRVLVQIFQEMMSFFNKRCFKSLVLKFSKAILCI